MTGTVAPPAPTLSTADRCDRCGAQARVRVVLANGELAFCGHHAKAFEPALRAQAIDWVDETDLII
ncbi:MAG: hypothetical protein ACLGIG_07865 [Actinomycetes bacterium]